MALFRSPAIPKFGLFNVFRHIRCAIVIDFAQTELRIRVASFRRLT